MEQKTEFVRLALSKSISLSELCRRYGISRPTAYKWLDRYDRFGLDGLNECSRRPYLSPRTTNKLVTDRLLKLKGLYSDWGAKKIRSIYLTKYDEQVPSVTTVHNIFKRNGLVDSKKSSAGATWNRFEYEFPNELWQMDFKGDFLMSNKKRCYPLTMEDDHSRFNVCLVACQNQQGLTVKSVLSRVFNKYGKPNTILCDNGSPWGKAGQNGNNQVKRITDFEKWLLLHDVSLIHGRPYHPQTQGKLERYHRTLKNELLSKKVFKNCQECQVHFDEWRTRYNEIRPHESLNQKPPITRYQPSTRKYEEQVQAYEYEQRAEMRKVCYRGFIKYRNQKIRIGKALAKDIVAILPYSESSFAIYFRSKMLAEIKYDSVKDVS